MPGPGQLGAGQWNRPETGRRNRRQPALAILPLLKPVPAKNQHACFSCRLPLVPSCIPM